jgi:5-methylcytosine-specific restriction endonuclease McrA
MLAAAIVPRAASHCPALVLNADHRPLSYFPLRVTILEEYDRVVHSARFEMKLPSVVSLKTYIKPARRPAFTRFNVFLRDQFECQYCGDPKDLTFDHVIPRTKGGRTTWENVVTACSPCNLSKGGRMPNQAKMHPRIRPHQPSVIELREHGRRFPPNYLHESWADYLYWDSELEP